MTIETSVLDGILNGAAADSSSLPSYIYAADSHNIGNDNFQFTDPSTWSQALENTGKFILGATLSSAHSFYNTGVAVGNFLGADLEEANTAQTLADIDDDLGQYYQENKSNIDLVGFIAGSFVPGLAGIRLANAGRNALIAAKGGTTGTNIGGALGLLQPSNQLAQAAAIEIAGSQAAFRTLTAGTTKALAAGAVGGILEGVAFEVAVQATLFKSPVLEGQDGYDVAKSLLIGGAFGGVLGGIIDGARTFGTIKRTVKAVNEAEKPFSLINVAPSAATPSEKLLFSIDQLEATPQVPLDSPFAAKFTSLREAKVRNLQNDIRTQIQALANNDAELGNTLADIVLGLDAKTLDQSFLHSTRVARISETLPGEKIVNKAAAKLAGAGVTDDIGESLTRIQYWKLHGENAGVISDELPRVLNLADGVKTKQGVLDKINKYGFKESKIWNAAAANFDHLQAEARYYWAENIAKIKDRSVVHVYDIPLQERYLQEWERSIAKLQDLERSGPTEKITQVSARFEDGTTTTFTNPDDFRRHLRAAKRELSEVLLDQALTIGRNGDGLIDEIAKITNVRNSWLNGAVDVANENADLFARQYYRQLYNDQLVKKGLSSPQSPLIDTTLLPSTAKVQYDDAAVALAPDGNELRGAAFIEARNKLYQEGVENAVAKNTGELYEQFPELPKELINKLNQYGAGPGLFRFANGAYGSVESAVEQIGAVTRRLQTKIKAETTARLESTAYKLANDTDAALEFETISRSILQTSEHYILNETGDALVHRGLADYRASLATGKKSTKAPPALQDGAPEIIPLRSQVVRDAVREHIANNARRVNGTAELRAAQGLESSLDPRTFYPTRPNPRDFKHFAFVYDPTITRGSAGHVSMIHAATDADLAGLISKVPGQYKVLTRNDVEAFKKAREEFDYDRTLNENYINADLKRAGAQSNFFPRTDSQKIAKDWLDEHFRYDDIYARELVSGKYQPQFAAIRKLGEQFTNISTSKFGTSFKYAEDHTRNPYLSYVKTALNLSAAADYPLLQGANEIIDTAFSRGVQAISRTFAEVRGADDLERVNAKLQELGVKTAYYDSALEVFANHSAPRGELSKFVRRANSILGTLTLRLDPLNAINNAIGANVLLGSETKSIINAIRRGDSSAVGALANLKDITLPGVGDSITSASKMIATSQRRYFSEAGKALKEEYRREGWITSLTQQFDSVIDDLSLRGSESSAELGGRINSAMAKAKSLAERGETLTGNRWAEEFNRFVAADVMKQFTEVALAAGQITQKEARSYINTFVNRTQANIQATQRPLVFNGPIGQAVGLFQSYQFNLTQQLLRHVSDGAGKDAALLLGLQGTLYGLNGLPAVNYINTHVVGTMSNNPQHKDLYSSTYGIFGQQAGDLLLYGLPSNLLQTNLYSRGDINPRQLTVIPVNPADIAIVNAFTTQVQNIKTASEQIIAGGSVWQTFLQGIEHNGLSRPLAGLAQVAQAFDGGPAFGTSRQGLITGSNDLFHVASLARLAGGRPLDEGIILDAAYRSSVYQSADTAKKKKLSKAIKSTGISDTGGPSASQLEQFAEAYAATGGDTKNFNRYALRQINAANLPAAQKIANNLKSPYSYNLQVIMGGKEFTAEGDQ